MIQVKEFLNYKNNDVEVNKWIQENHENIEIKDIKYSASFAQACSSYDGEAISGCLIMYETIKQPQLSEECIENFYKR